MTKDAYLHTRIDDETGEANCYFPMEITDPSVRSWAREQGYEITGTILGFRKIEAAMIPCKEKAVDKKGNEFFLPTPFEVQKSRYCQLIKDEMKEQEIAKQDGRCFISDGKGSIKRCPLRIPNPEYTPDNGQQKTIPVRCEVCKYEQHKCTHTMISVPPSIWITKNSSTKICAIPFAGKTMITSTSRTILSPMFKSGILS